MSEHLNDLFSESMQDPDVRRDFEKEWIAEEIVLQLEDRMRELGLTKKDLAVRMGCSAPNVTRLFRRGTNLTLGSLVDLAMALEHRFLAPKLVPLTEAAPWEPTPSVSLQIKTPSWAEEEGSASSPIPWNVQGIEQDAEPDEVYFCR
jgi:transcriptional regulator with XRE-family HTH domain